MGDRETVWAGMKQSSLLFLVSCLTFHKKSWKSVHPFFHNIINKHGSRKQKNRPRIQGVNRDIPKIFQIALCVMFVFFWKFHENPLSRFSVMLLTDIQTDRPTDNDENITFAMAEVTKENQTKFWPYYGIWDLYSQAHRLYGWYIVIRIMMLIQSYSDESLKSV